MTSNNEATVTLTAQEASVLAAVLANLASFGRTDTAGLVCAEDGDTEEDAATWAALVAKLPIVA